MKKRKKAKTISSKHSVATKEIKLHLSGSLTQLCGFAKPISTFYFPIGTAVHEIDPNKNLSAKEFTLSTTRDFSLQLAF